MAIAGRILEDGPFQVQPFNDVVGPKIKDILHGFGQGLVVELPGAP